MDELTARIQRAAESILENEALTDNLDDEGGQTLLDWGVELAKQVAQTTDGLDEAAAEAAMADKLAAIRRLLRAVNKRFDPTLVTDLSTDSQAMAEANTKLLEQVLEQVGLILEPNFTQPTPAQLTSFGEQTLQPIATPPALIASLRSFIEQHGTAQPAEQTTPTAPRVDTPEPVQMVATEAVVSIPPQPPITVAKPVASLASPARPISEPMAGGENVKTEPVLSQPDSSWAGRLFSNLRRFLKNAQNQS